MSLHRVKLVYSRILIFQYFKENSEGDQCLYWRVGLVILYFSRLAEDGTPVSKCVGVHTHHELYSVTCTLFYFIKYIFLVDILNMIKCSA